jgi:Flp pilus assembly protein TadD
LRAILLTTVACGMAACTADGHFEPFAKTATSATGESQGSPAEVLLRVARGTRDNGDLASAVTIYKRVHELSPNRADVLIEMGQTLAALGAHNEATEVFREALKLDAKSIDALRGLGNSLLAMNQPQLALEQFVAALAIQQDPRLYNGMGVVYDMNGNHASAQDSYRSGLNLAAGDPNLRNNLALSLALAGKFDEAIDILSPLVKHPRANPRHRQNLALIYGLAGRFSEAGALARLDFDEPTVQNNLAYYETLRALPAEQRAAAVLGITVLASPAPTPTSAPTATSAVRPVANLPTSAVVSSSAPTDTMDNSGSRPGSVAITSNDDDVPDVNFNN